MMYISVQTNKLVVTVDYVQTYSVANGVTCLQRRYNIIPWNF